MTTGENITGSVATLGFPIQVANSFDKITLKKTLKGALIAGGGVAVVYVLQYVAGLDFGVYTPIVSALCSILINAVNEYKSGLISN